MTPLPPTLRCAVGLLAGEALVVAALTGFVGYKDVTARGVVWSIALPVTAFAAAGAILLGLFARLLAHRRSWPRGPAVFRQLMLLPIGWYMTSAGVAWLGVPVLLLGLVGAGLLVAPATRAALGVE